MEHEASPTGNSEQGLPSGLRESACPALATLIVSVVGAAGLTAAYAKIPHEKSVERFCWALGEIIIILSTYLLFLR